MHYGENIDLFLGWIMEEDNNYYKDLGYKLIDSQDRYDIELRWFENELNEIRKDTLKRLKFPDPKRFFDLLDRSEVIGLFDKDFCDRKRQMYIDQYNDLNLRKKLSDMLERRRDQIAKLMKKLRGKK